MANGLKVNDGRVRALFDQCSHIPIDHAVKLRMSIANARGGALPWRSFRSNMYLSAVDAVESESLHDASAPS
jgi:hypothetical protein